MHIGYIFDQIAADADLAVFHDPTLRIEDHCPESSEALEHLATQLGAEFITLNHQYCAFVLKVDLSPVIPIRVKDSPNHHEHSKALHALSRGLSRYGLKTGNIYLMESPEWTRHGEPTNYEDFKRKPLEF